MGWAQANINLLPINKNVKQSEIQEWMDKSIRMALDDSMIDDGIQKRLDAALPLIRKTIDRVESGELEADTLIKQDGRG
jgi:acetylglutamate kinase